MKHRILVAALSLAVVVGLLIIGCTPEAAPPTEPEVVPPAEMEPVTLKLATFFTSDTDIRQVWTVKWGEAITEATDGKVKFDYFPAGQLVTAKERSDALDAGIIDATTWFSCGYTPEEYPFMAAINLIPMGYKCTYDRFKEVNEYVEELSAKNIRAHNQKYLWCMRGDYGEEWFFADPWDPDNLGANFEGKKIRSPGCEAVKIFLSVFGAQHVSMSAPEIYEAAQKGLIDGCTQGMSQYYHTNISEVFPHHLWGHPFFNFCAANGCIFRLDLWNSFPADIQDTITKVSEDTEEGFYYAYEAECDRLREDLLDRGEITYLRLPDDVRAEWKALLDPVLDEQLGEMFPDQWPKLSAFMSKYD